MANVVFGVAELKMIAILMYIVHTTINDIIIIKTINNHTHDLKASKVEGKIAINRIK